MTKLVAYILIIASAAVADRAFANFDQATRSINGTGEVLRSNEFEVGFANIHYGLTDRAMLSTVQPLGWLFVQSMRVKYKFEPLPALRFSPSIAATRMLGAGTSYATAIDIGADRGDRRQHSYNFSFQYNYAGMRESPVFDADDNYVGMEKKKSESNLMTFDYTYYTESGNAAYAGVYGVTPYIGFTWAFKHVHAGVFIYPIYGWQAQQYFPDTVMFDKDELFWAPLPYIYWRF